MDQHQFSMVCFKQTSDDDDIFDALAHHLFDDQSYDMVVPAWQNFNDHEERYLDIFNLKPDEPITETSSPDLSRKPETNQDIIQSLFQDYYHFDNQYVEQFKNNEIQSIENEHFFSDINLKQDQIINTFWNDKQIYRRNYQQEMELANTKKMKKKSKVKKNGELCKGDYVKNVWSNSFRFILRQFFSNKYQTQIEGLCSKYKTTFKKVKKYYGVYLNQLISLSKLKGLLDYMSLLNQEQESIKRVFYNFYIWFMRKRYTQHIIEADNIQYKDIYIKAKTRLLYLPNIRTKVKANKKSSADW